uniref:Uncharacterized protein n=1 Tax=Utricularia reniformis TaxID=192314 RepID=A0A1Y0B4H3_9LAMI|nr:hypothetical protein AEK19_MT2174 [Utricularia reniformis]ART32321.1 hypothetical protein AEK19_MT2174 [Utricularia reniformis]
MNETLNIGLLSVSFFATTLPPFPSLWHLALARDILFEFPAGLSHASG